jgi:hypothetical protein
MRLKWTSLLWTVHCLLVTRRLVHEGILDPGTACRIDVGGKGRSCLQHALRDRMRCDDRHGDLGLDHAGAADVMLEGE